tara:strand:- start:127 stop:606 length:480 start_codon:yes stop_codon:yes gene_type:complete
MSLETNIIKQSLLALVSFSGLIFGGMLQLIAPEEHNAGKKHFILLKRLFLLAIILLVNLLFGYLIWQQGWLLKEGLFVLLFDILIIILLLMEMKGIKNPKQINSLETKYFELLNYVIFIIPYHTIEIKQFKLVYLSLIFLYGLPLGTLLLKQYQENHKK